MKRIFRTRQEGRSFLENLGVQFDENDKVTFPEAPKDKTSQDLTIASMELAFAITRDGIPVQPIVHRPVEAIVSVWRGIEGHREFVRGVKGQFQARSSYPPSLVSQLTASLGPLLYYFEHGKFGKPLRIFARYDQRHIECYGDPRLLRGLRTLIVVDHEGTTSEDRDVAERTARFILGDAIQGKDGTLSHEELMERDSELIAGFCSMVCTADEMALTAQSEKWLGFSPEHYTLCDYSPEPPKPVVSDTPATEPPEVVERDYESDD